MNLLVRSTMSAVRTVAELKGLQNARVVCKTNKKGELVIALIVPPGYDKQWEP